MFYVVIIDVTSDLAVAIATYISTKGHNTQNISSNDSFDPPDKSFSHIPVAKERYRCSLIGRLM
jgi:hypothetical protein